LYGRRKRRCYNKNKNDGRYVMKSLKSLSDNELVNRLRKLVEKEKDITFKILPHLVEVHRRGLYLAKGHGTLYEYCKGELGYTDASAWRRVGAALAIHRCPEAFSLLEKGRVNMCTLGRIHKFITPSLLREICDKSKAEVELIAAAYDAKGATPDRTRPVMVPKAVERNDKTGSTEIGTADVGETPADRPTSNRLRSEVGMTAESRNQTTSLRSEVNGTDKRLEFEQKWKVEGVVSERVKRKLDRCKSLLSNKYPNGVDYDILFDELTERFLSQKDPERRNQRRQKRQEKQAAQPADTKPTSNPTGKYSSLEPNKIPSRHIPRSVQEKVWHAAGGRCTFVGTNGRRCNSTHNLQLDHYPIPFGRGGPNTVDNLRHNVQSTTDTWESRSTERSALRSTT
jgi:hypothetical protein